jgi:hypothetical protein
VFRALALLPKLQKLSLCILLHQSFNYGRLDFHALMHGDRSNDGKIIQYDGEEQTAAGLAELLAAHLASEDDDQAYLLVFREPGGCRTCGRGTVALNDHLL